MFVFLPLFYFHRFPHFKLKYTTGSKTANISLHLAQNLPGGDEGGASRSAVCVCHRVCVCLCERAQTHQMQHLLQSEPAFSPSSLFADFLSDEQQRVFQLTSVLATQRQQHGKTPAIQTSSHTLGSRRKKKNIQSVQRKKKKKKKKFAHPTFISSWTPPTWLLPKSIKNWAAGHWIIASRSDKINMFTPIILVFLLMSPRLWSQLEQQRRPFFL